MTTIAELDAQEAKLQRKLDEVENFVRAEVAKLDEPRFLLTRARQGK